VKKRRQATKRQRDYSALKIDTEIHAKFHSRLERGLLELEDTDYESVTRVILAVIEKTLPVLIKKK
jgi:hypothetical protein